MKKNLLMIITIVLSLVLLIGGGGILWMSRSSSKSNQLSAMVLRAPSPVIRCDNPGKWSSGNAGDCEECLKQGKDYFYCDGVCMDKHLTGAYGCSEGQPIAKILEQCNAPCAALNKSYGGECSDKYDCAPGKDCVTKYEPKAGMEHGKCV